MQAEPKTIPIVAQSAPDCDDRDEDCPGIEDKVNCWLYAPERGMCPYLRPGVDVVDRQRKEGEQP